MTEFTKQQVVDITKSIKSAEKNHDYVIELWSHAAKLAKIKYDAYIAAGFTEAQALELVRAK